MDDSPPTAAIRPFSEDWYRHLQQTLGDSTCKHLGFYAIPSSLTLSVVIPIYNERETLLDVLARVKAVPIRKEIILVDDGSRDGTRDLLNELKQHPQDDSDNTLNIIFHDVNQGKGAAVRTGFLAAQGDVVL
ncbi:MAG: glycosyltransferase family 2 protein, partial [Planctomycetaceae bacterium]